MNRVFVLINLFAVYGKKIFSPGRAVNAKENSKLCKIGGDCVEFRCDQQLSVDLT